MYSRTNYFMLLLTNVLQEEEPKWQLVPAKDMEEALLCPFALKATGGTGADRIGSLRIQICAKKEKCNVIRKGLSM